MSRFLLPTLCLTLLIFSGCPPDTPLGEDDLVITEEDFYGSWRVSRLSSDYTITGSFLGEPIDERGTSSISDSDLSVEFAADGTWSSSGDYRLTVTTEGNIDVTDQSGIGGGRWSFRSDTLFFNGMRNYATTGRFGLEQDWVITDFTRDAEAGIQTSIDQTEVDNDFGTEVRTQSDWDVLITR